jgi:FkbM family methyltransferase|tara:strand:- start:2115 stop:2759 length:645 start_codon:yes stop_codon:yes gene_type:complete
MIEKINGFWVPGNDIHVEHWKKGNPFTQNKCLEKFLQYCESQNKKFKCALDIGAWCGTWSKAMEKHCRKIIAFEPDKVNFECLMKNCTINCEPRREAVGSKRGTVSLTEDNFTQAKRIIEDGIIPIHPIDYFNYNDIDLIKIDVEGYEMEVLKGANKTLTFNDENQSNVQFVMIELNNNTKKYGSNNQDVERHLRGLGFNVLIEHWPDKVFYRA